MRVKEVEGGYMLRLEKGEELIASLAELMRERHIGCGSVTGLGAVDRARLGCYLLSDQDYASRDVEGDLEVRVFDLRHTGHIARGDGGIRLDQVIDVVDTAQRGERRVLVDSGLTVRRSAEIDAEGDVEADAATDCDRRIIDRLDITERS